MDYDKLIPSIREMLASEIVIGSWLTNLGETKRLQPAVQQIIDDAARDSSFLHWDDTLKQQLFSGWPVPALFAEQAYRETAASTAVYLSHVRLGVLEVSDEMAHAATRLLDQFIQRASFSTFLSIYAAIITYENYQALQYYETLPLEVFLSGERHRPWTQTTLDDDLALSQTAGDTELISGDNEQLVALTKQGQARLADIRHTFKVSGLLNTRSMLMRISGFSRLEQYEDILAGYMPRGDELRRDFLRFAGIQPGMHVLEIGCGTGLLTLDSGLADMVGQSGCITATDPSVGMLARADAKRQQRQIEWVKFQQARAEELPFEDNTFDAVVGSAFIHFTDIPQALKEFHRVLKPGGIFATLIGLNYPQAKPFFAEWFEPLFHNMPLHSKRKDILPSRETVPSLMPDGFTDVVVRDCASHMHYHNPENIVTFIIQVADVFEEAMIDLPWQARQDIIQELIERGRAIVDRSPWETLIEEHPGQQVRAVAR